MTGEEKTLLLVEDDRPLRERLARALETRGFTVTQAESVAEGKARAKDTPPAFAVERHSTRATVRLSWPPPR